MTNHSVSDFPTILLVEGDSTLRLALADILRRKGYLVLEADDVSDAMQIARTHSRHIHVLITSMSLRSTLPKLLKPYRPNLCVLAVAKDDGDAKHSGTTGAESILKKIRCFFQAA